MSVGEALAGVIIKAAAIGHHILGNWVVVTNASAEDGGRLEFVVSPVGIEFGRRTAEIVESYASVLAAIVDIPDLSVSIVRLLSVLVV
ncbi:MAG: hypothetical protein QUS33_10160 [Dehalococcoidia bacterium]|nr:hypothetical protein [Dehalococcoidia bacterium]